MTEPRMLVCTRLNDMTLMHPDQGWDLCHECGYTVGLYPTGKKMLEAFPKLKILCSRCAHKFITDGDEIAPAGTKEEFIREYRESKPVGHS